MAGIGYISPNKGSLLKTQTIHVYDGGDGVSIFEAEEIHPEVKIFVCLEVSIEDDVLFLGAGGGENGAGDAFLFALSFDENAETVAEARYGSDKGFRCVNVVRRHKEGNVLFIGEFFFNFFCWRF